MTAPNWANAVSVTARRRGDVTAGSVIMRVAQIFGVQTQDVQAQATAALGYLNPATGLPPGPFHNIAMSKKFLDDIIAGLVTPDFIFSPTTADNGAWCGPSTESNINANKLKDWISNGNSPGIANSVYMLNGWADSVLQALQQVWSQPANQKNYDTAYGTVTGMLVVLPVVDVVKMNGTSPVVGFQSIIITDVVSHGNDKSVKFELSNQMVGVAGGESGGPVSNLIATRPKLVQ